MTRGGNEKMAQYVYYSELYHHGILGQKWGHKNGPPYPLDSSDHSTSENKAGWRKSLTRSSSSSGDINRTGISAKNKKKINKIQERSDRSVAGIQKDIDSYSPYSNTGIKAKNGKTVMTSDDVNEIIGGLEAAKNLTISNSSKEINEIVKNSKLSSTTKKTISDYDNLSDQEFKQKYSVDKSTYAKRLEKYGDPYLANKGNSYANGLAGKSAESLVNAEQKAIKNLKNSFSTVTKKKK